MARSVIALNNSRKIDKTNYVVREKRKSRRTCCNCGEKFEVQEVKFMIKNKIFCSWNCKCEFKRKNKIE